MQPISRLESARTHCQLQGYVFDGCQLLTLQRELEKVSNGIRMSEEKERKFADELAEKEVVEAGADLVALRNVSLKSFDYCIHC